MKLSVIVFASLVAVWLLRRQSAALRHWVLAVGLCCAAAAPAVAPWLPRLSLPLAVSPSVRFAADDGGGAQARVSSPEAPMGAAGVHTTGRRGRGLAMDRYRAVALVWALGSAMALGVLVTGVARLTWLARRARTVRSGPWQEICGEVARAFGLRRPVTVLLSDHRSLLVTWGFWRPKIVLPAGAAGWSDSRVRLVLTHEIAHIARGDWFVQLLGEMLRAFYWFNPLVWVACRRLRLESERACDDEVINRGVPGRDYAEQLIDLARVLTHQGRGWYPAPAMARPSSLERRVRAMLNGHVDRKPVTLTVRGVVLAVALAVSAAVAAAQNGFVSLSGSIADEQGRGVPDTTVALVSSERRARYEVASNATGAFEFVGLPAGEYALEVRALGFRPLSDTVTVSGQNLQRSYTLQLGALQETIIVRDGPDPMNPSQAREASVKPRACVPSAAGGRIVPPRKIRDYAPVFPTSLRGSGTVGTVMMNARIGLDGYVKDIAIVGDAHPELADSAVAAVREWRFTETLLNCQPVEVSVGITVRFEGMPPPPPPAPQP